jgi:pyruvate/oxaloacetate carboxyltransferase
VNYVVSKIKGEDPYSNVSKNFAELVKGSYGKTPWPVDPNFRLKICGTKEEIPYDTSNYRKQPNPPVAEAGNHLLALDEKEALLLELFPSVAEKFLKGRRIAEWASAPDAASATRSKEPSAGFKAASTPLDPEGVQYFTAPSFSSEAAALPPDYEVLDGHPAEYWQFEIENAE